MSSEERSDLAAWPDRLVTAAERRQIVPLSDSSVFRRERAGLFPKRRRLGSRVFWLLTELIEYMRSLPQGAGEPPKGLSAAVYQRNRARLRQYNRSRRRDGRREAGDH